MGNFAVLVTLSSRCWSCWGSVFIFIFDGDDWNSRFRFEVSCEVKSGFVSGHFSATLDVQAYVVQYVYWAMVAASQRLPGLRVEFCRGSQSPARVYFDAGKLKN